MAGMGFLLLFIFIIIFYHFKSKNMKFPTFFIIIALMGFSCVITDIYYTPDKYEFEEYKITTKYNNVVYPNMVILKILSPVNPWYILSVKSDKIEFVNHNKIVIKELLDE